LQLLEDKEAVIARIYRMLKPGGIFVSSTICLGNTMRYLKVIVPIGKFFNLIPVIRFFTAQELEDSLMTAGFEIDHRWRPGKGKTVFIVAKKTE